MSSEPHTPVDIIDDELLTRKEVEHIFKVSRWTIDQWRRDGKLHAIYPMGRPTDPDKRGNYPVRYRRSEVNWILKGMEHDDVV